MNEPRHIYFSTVTAVFQPHIHPKERDNDVRFTQTSGEEWDALIARARRIGLNGTRGEMRDMLYDLLTYFGETP